MVDACVDGGWRALARAVGHKAIDPLMEKFFFDFFLLFPLSLFLFGYGPGVMQYLVGGLRARRSWVRHGTRLVVAQCSVGMECRRIVDIRSRVE